MLDLWLLDGGGSPEWDRPVPEERQVGLALALLGAKGLL